MPTMHRWWARVGTTLTWAGRGGGGVICDAAKILASFPGFSLFANQAQIVESLGTRLRKYYRGNCIAYKMWLKYENASTNFLFAKYAIRE